MDVVVDVRARSQGTQWLSSRLQRRGFTLPGVNTDGIGHHVTKPAVMGDGTVIFDVLGPVGFAMDVGRLVREAYGDRPASVGEPLDALYELGAALRAPTPPRPPKWSPSVGTCTAASSTIGATEGSRVPNGVRAQASTSSTPASSAACADAALVNATAQPARSSGVAVTTNGGPGGDPAEQDARSASAAAAARRPGWVRRRRRRALWPSWPPSW